VTERVSEGSGWEGGWREKLKQPTSIRRDLGVRHANIDVDARADSRKERKKEH
jgi:hypothetical protein